MCTQRTTYRRPPVERNVRDQRRSGSQERTSRMLEYDTQCQTVYKWSGQLAARSRHSRHGLSVIIFEALSEVS